jgi:hypothetical protein
VWWPDSLTRRWDVASLKSVDLFALVLSIAAGVALVRFRQSVPRVVLAAGLIGLLRWLATS